MGEPTANVIIGFNKLNAEQLNKLNAVLSRFAESVGIELSEVQKAFSNLSLSMAKDKRISKILSENVQAFAAEDFEEKNSFIKNKMDNRPRWQR